MKRWKNRLLASGEFDPYFANSKSHIAVMDMRDGLSPNESADGVIETMQDMRHIIKSGG